VVYRIPRTRARRGSVGSLNGAGVPTDRPYFHPSYALLLADTVKVGKESGILLTEGTKRPHEVILDEGVSLTELC
jgi:hypothetical protein